MPAAMQERNMRDMAIGKVQLRLLNAGLDLFSLLVLLIVYQYGRLGEAKTQSNRLFLRIQEYLMIALAGDMLGWIMNGRPDRFSRMVLYLGNDLYMLSQLLAAITALQYMYFMCRGRQISRRQEMAFLWIPFAVIAVLTLSTPLTHLVYTVNAENAYQRGVLLPVFSILTLAYILAGSALCFLQAQREVLRIARRKYMILAAFSIPVICGSLFQTVFYGFSTVLPCSVLSVLIVFANEQSLKISADPLTGLNNRGCLDRYLQQCLDSGGCGDLCVVMMDINGFKGINDRFGHVAGDHILIDMADLMRHAFEDTGCFLARYGGDEFSIVLHTGSISPQEAIRRMQAQIDAFRKTSDPCASSFGVSMGYAECEKDAAGTAEMLIRKADERMYEAKREMKAAERMSLRPGDRRDR